MANDPRTDINEAMDRAGLQATTFLATQKPMAQIVLMVRQKLQTEMVELIERRENPPAGPIIQDIVPGDTTENEGRTI